MAKRLPKYFIHENGFIMPKSFSPENFLSALQYVPSPDDVFICTYPKCGTTWLQCILHLMLNDGQPLKEGQSINEIIPHIEEKGAALVEGMSRPRVIKTHLPYELTPKSSAARYIYVSRNPKDCCVSFYHHTKGFARHYDFEGGTFDDFFELFLEGKVDFGDYFDNLLSWIAHKDDPNVLFILYEEMKADTLACIRKLGLFLGDPFRQSIEDPAVLDKVLQNSSFGAMKACSSIWSSEQCEGSAGFIRKGQVGNWRSYFTEDQARKLDEKFLVKLSGTKAEHIWDDYDC